MKKIKKIFGKGYCGHSVSYIGGGYGIKNNFNDIHILYDIHISYICTATTFTTYYTIKCKNVVILVILITILA